MTYLRILIIICILSTFSAQATVPFFKSLFNSPKIAEPYIDSDLTIRHHKLDHYPNKLDYKDKDDYIVLYGDATKWLLDMEGNILNSWSMGPKSNFKRSRLMPNCNLMIIDGHNNKSINEINTKGQIIWQYESPGMVHHDFEVDDQGRITFFYHTQLPKGFYPDNGCKRDEIITDAILQIDRSGKKIFEWLFHEHLTPSLRKDKCTPERRAIMAKSNFAKKLDWVHPNALNILKENKWYKKGYKEFKPGNILVTSHHLSKIFIIDKDTKKIVWFFKKDKIALDGPHEAKMIPEGYPGAGNILIHDNGKPHRKYTRIIELNPITKKEVWSYQKPGIFFNQYAGSQSRLKNGDTFISDDTNSRVFIVNKKGKTLWQYTKPDSAWVRRAVIYKKKNFAHCLR